MFCKESISSFSMWLQFYNFCKRVLSRALGYEGENVCIVHPIYERICHPLNCGSMWLDCCCQNWRNLKSQGGSSKTWFCWMTRSSLLASIRKFAASSATDCLFGFGPRSGAMVLPPPDLFLWFCFWFWILLTSHILLFWSTMRNRTLFIARKLAKA
jgi:hypothetical protein